MFYGITYKKAVVQSFDKDRRIDRYELDRCYQLHFWHMQWPFKIICN